MTPSLQSLPESSAKPLGEWAWLDLMLACPTCREPRPAPARDEFRCQHIETHFSLRNGIVYPDEDEPLLLGEQRKVWESLEKAQGTYDLPLEKLLLMPEDPEARTLLDWLRTFLRGRGSLRVLQLNARRGWAARALAEDGHQVVAGDLLDDPHIGLGCAVRLREQTGQHFACVRSSPTALPFRPGAFDAVVSFGMLREIPDLHRIFQEISRVLRPGGLFLALQEPFRGVLTTQTQRLLDTPFYRLARWWLPGKFPRTAAPEVLNLRSRLGATLHEARRRVPFCLAQSQAARLQTTILPTAVTLSLPANFSPTSPDGQAPAWLASLARAFRLDIDRLQSLVDLGQTLGYDLIPELLGHWVLVGNIDGVLLGRKNSHELQSFPTLSSTDAERARRLDPLLLACAPDGFLPIYGVHSLQVEDQERYSWIMPQAGLLVRASHALEVTIACPAKPFCDRPVGIEFRLETERVPVAVLLVRSGKKVTFKLPIPASAVRHASVFVSITTNFGFLPSDFNPAPGSDTRVLAVQLHGIRAGQEPGNDPAAVLRQVIQGLA